MHSHPVENVLARLAGVHRNGSGATAKCPAHDDRRNSLSVGEGDEGRALLKCHAGCSSDEIVARLGLAAADLFVPRQAAKQVVAEYAYRNAAGTALYVVERREPKDFRQRRPDGAGGWIWNLQGVEPLPYRLPEMLAAPLETIVIVEGEKDADRLAELGFIATTNSGGAGKWRPELSRHFAGRKVVIIPDNDDAGTKHALGVATALRSLASTVSVLHLPDLPPKGDVSDWLNGGGTAEQLRTMIGTVRPFDFESSSHRSEPITGVVEFDRLLPDVEALYEAGLQRGVSTGLASLDRLFTVRKGDLTLVTGIPGSGKSELVDFILMKIARREGWRFAMFSPESYPVARHAANIIEKAVGKPFGRGPSDRMTLATVRTAAELLRHHFRFLDPADDDRNVDGLLRIVAALDDAEKLDGVVLDPWNELDHSRPAGMTETEHISVSLSRIRRFARDRNLAFFIVAHPAKLLKVGTAYPVPTPYDIAGSAHWRNKADNCLAVWRDTSEGDRPEVEVHVQKVRFREVGRLGMLTLLYDKVTGRYSDADTPRVAPWEVE